MPQEHVIMKQQSAWKTWVTPDVALSFVSFSLDPAVSRVRERVTGTGRQQKYSWLGPKLPVGSFEMWAWYEYLGLIFEAAGLNDIASTQQAATAAYEHGFLPGTTPGNGLSVQLKRDADDADNILGLLINRLQLNCQAGQQLTLSGDYIACDEAPTDGTWDYDGATAAPAVVATPSYPAATILPFRFEQASLITGGTVSFDDPTNILSVSGGAAATVEVAELTLDNGLDSRVFLGSRVAGNVVSTEWAVTGRFDVDQSTVDETFRNLYRAGSQTTLQLLFDSGVEADTGYNYQLEVIVPNIDFDMAALPDLSGSQDRRMQSVEFTGLVDDNDLTIGIRLVDTQTAY